MIENETQLKQTQLQLLGFLELRSYDGFYPSAELFISSLAMAISNYRKTQHHGN